MHGTSLAPTLIDLQVIRLTSSHSNLQRLLHLLMLQNIWNGVACETFPPCILQDFGH